MVDEDYFIKERNVRVDQESMYIHVNKQLYRFATFCHQKRRINSRMFKRHWWIHDNSIKINTGDFQVMKSWNIIHTCWQVDLMHSLDSSGLTLGLSCWVDQGIPLSSVCHFFASGVAIEEACQGLHTRHLTYLKILTIQLILCQYRSSVCTGLNINNVFFG